VIGPRFIPRLRDRRPDRELARRNPELAVLSVVAHGKDTDDEEALAMARVAMEAVAEIGDWRSVLYSDTIAMAVNEVVRQKLEEHMRPGEYEIQSESVRIWYEKLQEAEKKGEERGEKRGEERGLIQGKLQALLRNLEGRGIELNEGQRETMLQCTDPDTVDRWLDRSLTAASADELFH
jgi:hypothetical protein